jgi:hypothetical protein
MRGTDGMMSPQDYWRSIAAVEYGEAETEERDGKAMRMRDRKTLPGTIILKDTFVYEGEA